MPLVQLSNYLYLLLLYSYPLTLYSPHTQAHIPYTLYTTQNTLNSTLIHYSTQLSMIYYSLINP